MTRRLHRLPRWQWHGLVASGALLTLTGAAWLALHYTVGAGAGELPHPAEAWLMRLHGLASFVVLFVLGALAAAHIPHGWHMTLRPRGATQRRLGIALCALGALLAATGYALYYFAPDAVRPALGLSHAALGLAAAVLTLWHGSRIGWNRR